MMNLLQGPSQAIAALVFLGELATATSTSTSTASATLSAQTGATYTNGFDISKSWSNLSPYKDADFGLPKGVPGGCELSEVHALHRHAERFPGSGLLEADGMENFHSKVVNYSKAHPNKAIGQGPLRFLNDWTYLLGQDLLLDSGAATETTAGADFWSRYGRLLYHSKPGAAAWDPSLNTYSNGTLRPKPVFRTTSQSRILESTRWWLSGFFGNIGANSSYSQYDLIVIPEDKGFNNTLASTKACSGDYDVGEKTAYEFVSRYTNEAVTRLSKFLPPGFNLTAIDVLSMQNLCPYETATLGTSSFCSLFTEQEWRDYAYSVDLRYYSEYSFGSPTGRAYGIGYVLELAARLQSNLIHSSDTTINSTYDDNTAQFPLHQPFYMDMSHEHVILSVLTSLGLDYFRHGSHGLPGSVNHTIPHTFQLGNMTPFGSRLISEVWTCPSNTSFDDLKPTLYTNPDLSASADKKDYIRFVLNNAPLPLSGLPGCEETAKNGFCPVEAFLHAVPSLKKEAMYQHACFGNYSTDAQVGNGTPE